MYLNRRVFSGIITLKIIHTVHDLNHCCANKQHRDFTSATPRSAMIARTSFGNELTKLVLISRNERERPTLIVARLVGSQNCENELALVLIPRRTPTECGGDTQLRERALRARSHPAEPTRMGHPCRSVFAGAHSCVNELGTRSRSGVSPRMRTSPFSSRDRHRQSARREG